MNRLTTEKRAQIIGCLVKGMSMWATVRVTGEAKNTVAKLLVDLGQACSEFQDCVLRDLPRRRLQFDALWSFVCAKAKNVPENQQGEFGHGDVWTRVAIDADSKLVLSWLVGRRDTEDAIAFVSDVADRMKNRVQLTTDGCKPYLTAVDRGFGSDVDFAVLQMLYGIELEGEKRYSPAKCIGADKSVVRGHPDPEHISTSYVPRQNLTMRMGMRRFTRLTNDLSKKVENLAAAVSLHFMYCNFARPHKSLANPYPRTLAVAAGVSDHAWTLEENVGLLDSN
jgi:hypothetical protein